MINELTKQKREEINEELNKLALEIFQRLERENPQLLQSFLSDSKEQISEVRRKKIRISNYK
jgi:hypothetical protein